MLNQHIYQFPDASSPTLSEVGGKGLSLVLSSKEGLPVPPGFILSVKYFTPWVDELKKTKSWPDFLKAEQHNLEKSCNVLKDNAIHLPYTKVQEQTLAEALKNTSTGMLFAVRSSSPEEDLEGSSFAGGYETVLGITHQHIKKAIQRAFASCLDYRVEVYKLKNGFDITDPQIAVIIQEQIASDVAGVGFSLNPVTNNFDEAVITANWGLGETVVAGIATPDTYTVDKGFLHIQNKQLGAKETTIQLLPNGGTQEKKDTRKNNQFTLSDMQILEVTKLIKKVETLYQKPMDIEWAYAKERLYLLQARPITTYIPLPQAMLTNPHEKKRLYLDFTLSLQGMNQPISVTGTSLFTILMKRVGKMLFFRDITSEIRNAIPWISPGRMYLNLSNVLRLVDKKKVANFITILDPLAAKTLLSINEKEYISHTSKLKLLPFGVIRFLPKIALQVFQAKHFPKRTHQKSQQRLKKFMQKARDMVASEMSFVELADKLLLLVINNVFLNTPPLFITGNLALNEMKKIAGKELADKFAPLEVALPNNMTTEMGLALNHVAELTPANLTEKDLLAGIKKRTLPSTFLSAWDTFLKEYGFRGPLEMDIAAPRYEDKPEMLITLLISMRDNKTQDNPIEKFRKNQEKSRTAYVSLYHEIEKKDKGQARRFQKLFEIYETFAGYRETHKFYLIFALHLLRQRILKEAQLLYDASRLDSVVQIFDLTLDEIDKARRDTTFNLIERAKTNRKFIDRLAHITSLPTIFDSRGCILRNHMSHVNTGEVSGTPISPGIVKGKIKVLHTPDEKPFLKGEILVARATDPGWTPLFANAAAVILEIGGVLQHGALVAREYGLPCVTGIENATTLWKDGTVVEVNGTEGIVRLVENPKD